MISDNLPNRPSPTEALREKSLDGSYLDWAAILAGGIFALALSFLLISFGASLGLSLASPRRGEGMSAAWLAIAAGVWFIWVMISAFGAGGYLTGRMRRRAGDATADEVSARDGAHGLMVWATGALFGMVVAASGVGGLLGAGSAAVGSTVGSVADVASAAAQSEYFANLLLRNGMPEGDEVPEAATATGPETGPTNAGSAPVDAEAAEPPTVAPAVQREIAGILARSLADGALSDRDRTYLARRIAANTDLDADAATARVTEVMDEIDAARAAAIDLAEEARVAGVIVGFVTAATLLVGAIAAFLAAIAGGHHRDEGLGLALFPERR